MKTAIVFLCLVAACLAYPDKRIVNGDPADLYAHPHQASLQRFYSTGWFHICGATIISPTKLVTAAHCVDNQPTNYLRIVVGALKITETTNYQQSKSLSRYIKHDRYSANSPGYPNDIAVIYLSSAITYNNNVQPATLAPKGSSYADSECVITGWGRTDGSDSSSAAVHLKEALITKITNSACAGYWGNSINSNHICVFERYGSSGNRPSACNGDSGGPMMCGSNKQYLAGVTSWGVSNCSGDYPSVYTRVSNYVDWINSA